MLIAWWIFVVLVLCGNLVFWMRRLEPVRRAFMAEHPNEWARMNSKAQSAPGKAGGRILLWHALTFILIIALGGVGAAAISGNL